MASLSQGSPAETVTAIKRRLILRPSDHRCCQRSACTIAHLPYRKGD
jgi:hypothetical protein